uniref:protein disulfide-isomerase n=1 Tax=Cacopsylla melanoneura TaxID=428564 RepID=A0A8D8XZ19_9HEMI
MMNPIVLGLLLTVASVHCLYPSYSDVIKLTASNFDSKVVNSDEVWIVEYYAPWCGHCQSFKEEYMKLATALKGVVKVGGVNADEEQSLSSSHGVQGFPTIKIFSDKKNPTPYNGARTADAIIDVALEAIRQKVKGGKSGGRKGSKNAVVELTDSNFAKLVYNSDEIWLVEFFAPWCGHCKNLAPHWEKAASELEGKVKLGAVDATVHQSIGSEFNIRGYPTIKFFSPGSRSASDAQEYNGGRTADDIVNWALSKYTENVPSPEIKQIVSEATFKEACEDRPLCIVAVLPHILDCQSSCRNNYLDILQKLGDKYKQKVWGWIWNEAVAQPDLENVLEIGGFGYPAMAVLNAKKMKYSLLKGPFSYDGINEFLRDLSYGRGHTAPVKGAALPKINTVDPWDGKDGELPPEEDIDLSDVELDELPKDEL